MQELEILKTKLSLNINKDEEILALKKQLWELKNSIEDVTLEKEILKRP